jgi:crossover junction endodeoxyribonuclease RuvC
MIEARRRSRHPATGRTTMTASAPPPSPGPRAPAAAVGARGATLVLGLDPGSQVTGWGLVETVGSRVRAVDEGCITCRRDLAVADRLASMCRELRTLLARWQPAAAVVERPFHGVNARSLIVLAEVRGALLATLAESGLAVDEYTPAEVKMAVTGNGRAEKGQVARMVRLLLGQSGAGPVRHDATDALALAICWAHRRRLDRLS